MADLFAEGPLNPTDRVSESFPRLARFRLVLRRHGRFDGGSISLLACSESGQVP